MELTIIAIVAMQTPNPKCTKSGYAEANVDQNVCSYMVQKGFALKWSGAFSYSTCS